MIGPMPYYMENKEWYEFFENDVLDSYILTPKAPKEAVDSYIQEVLDENDSLDDLLKISEEEVRQYVNEMLDGTFKQKHKKTSDFVYKGDKESEDKLSSLLDEMDAIDELPSYQNSPYRFYEQALEDLGDSYYKDAFKHFDESMNKYPQTTLKCLKRISKVYEDMSNREWLNIPLYFKEEYEDKLTKHNYTAFFLNKLAECYFRICELNKGSKYAIDLCNLYLQRHYKHLDLIKIYEYLYELEKVDAKYVKEYKEADPYFGVYGFEYIEKFWNWYEVYKKDIKRRAK